MLSVLFLLLACEDPPAPAAPSTTDAAGAIGQNGGIPGGAATTPGGPANGATPSLPPNGAAPNGATASGAAPDVMSVPPKTECDALAADATIPKKKEDVAAMKGQGRVWTDQQIRNSYLCEVARAASLDADAKKAGTSAEQRAKAAFAIRHDARAVARAMLADAAKIQSLETADTQKFGNADGPDFDHLVKKAKEKGLSGDAMYEDVILVILTRSDLDKALGI